MPEITVPISTLQKYRLFLATPMYGGACYSQYSKSVADLSALCTHHKIALQIYYLQNESLIPRARNYAVDEFLRSECTHFIFIDADIGFSANDVLGMMALQGVDSDYHILAGAYPKKCISWEKIKVAIERGLGDNPSDLEKYVGDYVFNPKGGQTQISLKEPVEVLELGTGFMMIQRKALEKFRDSYPQYSYNPDHVRSEHFAGDRKITQFFQSEIDNFDQQPALINALEKIISNPKEGKVIAQKAIDEYKQTLLVYRRYLSEDYWFTRRCQEIGLRTWLVPWVKLTHTGSMIFGGSLEDMARLQVTATADPAMLGKKK